MSTKPTHAELKRLPYYVISSSVGKPKGIRWSAYGGRLWAWRLADPDWVYPSDVKPGELQPALECGHLLEINP